MKQIEKTIIISTIIIATLFFMQPNHYDSRYFSNDYLFHFAASGGKIPGTQLTSTSGDTVDLIQTTQYPPTFHIISTPFTARLETYFLWTLLLIFFAIPITIQYFTKTWFTSLAWISTSIPYTLINSGTIVQAFAMLIFIPFIYTKNNWVRIAIIIIMPTIHAYAIWLFLGYWVIEILWTKKKEIITLGACTFIPTQRLEGIQLKQRMIETADKSIMGETMVYGPRYIDFPRFFTFCPTLIFGFIGLWKENKELLILVIILLASGIVLLWMRLWTIAGMILIIGLGRYYITSNKRMKKLLIIASILLTGMQIWHQASIWNGITFSITTAINCAIHIMGLTP